MSFRDLFLLVLLGALMGSAFLFLKVAAPVVGPIFLIFARVSLAAALMVGWGILTRQALRFGRPLKDWLILGTLNAALPFTLIAWGELHLTASLASILIATLPLFTALVSAVWLKEAFHPRKVFGLVLGLAGVVILSGWSPLEAGPQTLTAILAVLLASLSYAVASVFIKRQFQGVSRLSVTAGNFASAGLVLLPLSFTTLPSAMPPIPTLWAMLALAVVGTVIPYLLYFHLLDRLAATTVTSIGYLIPAFGALWGAVFLAEPINTAMLLGFALVLLSVGLVSGIGLFPGGHAWPPVKRPSAAPSYLSPVSKP